LFNRHADAKGQPIISAFRQRNLTDQSNLDDVIATIRLASLVLAAEAIAFGQTAPVSPAPRIRTTRGHSNDLFVMFGSDLVRPGLLPKPNYNIVLGHTFKFLGKDPIGDEITFAYTYEMLAPNWYYQHDRELICPESVLRRGLGFDRSL
jgi:hypothetical protein